MTSHPDLDERSSGGSTQRTLAQAESRRKLNSEMKAGPRGFDPKRLVDVKVEGTACELAQDPKGFSGVSALGFS